MSTLTPDGDTAKLANVAIRPNFRNMRSVLPSHEAAMLRCWAAECADPKNRAALLRLVSGLSQNR